MLGGLDWAMNNQSKLALFPVQKAVMRVLENLPSFSYSLRKENGNVILLNSKKKKKKKRGRWLFDTSFR